MKKINKTKKVIVENVEEALNASEEDSDEEKTDAYEEHACEFLNEAECEEELDDDALGLEDTEKKHFGEENEE